MILPLLTSDIYLGQRSISSLSAGSTSSGTSTVTIPSTTAPGSYYIGAIADATGVVAESDETNNAAFSTTQCVVTTTSPKPDLMVTSLAGPTSGQVGKSISITSTVKNQGAASTGTTSYVKFYLSTDTEITPSDIYLGQRSISSLTAGSSSSGTSTVTIPSTTALGSYYIGAIADATGVVAESNETNNAAFSTTQCVVSSAPRPDLIVSSLKGPTSGQVGKSISITSTVKNQGAASTRLQDLTSS